MTQRKTARKTKSAKPPAPLTPAQEANQITWRLKGELKNARLACLRIGGLLSKVRDKKLYAALGFPDIESYAADRLQLGKTTLYQYIHAYDWACQNHPEWLQPKPKGFIPDLSDIADMIWIEKELVQKKMSPKRREGLEALKSKALDGQLRKKDLDTFIRRGPKGTDSLKAFESKLRSLRTQGGRLVGMPQEVMTHLDAAITILKNGQPLAQCRFPLVDSADKGISA